MKDLSKVTQNCSLVHPAIEPIHQFSSSASPPPSLSSCILKRVLQQNTEGPVRSCTELLLGPPNPPTHQSASSTSSPPPPSLSPCRRCMESSSLPMDLSSVSRTSARNLRALVRFLISTTFCRISSPSLPRSATTRSSSSAWASTRGWGEDGKRGGQPRGGRRQLQEDEADVQEGHHRQELPGGQVLQHAQQLHAPSDRPTDCRAAEVLPCTETKGPPCSPRHSHRVVVFCGHPFTGKMFQWLPLHR